MEFKRIVIIGMGLIGGSIGKALLERGLADEVVGVCRRESSLERAVKEKSLTKGFVDSYDEATKGSDLVVIATPVHTIKPVLDGLSEVLSGGNVLVTDVGSTKKNVVEYAAQYSDKFAFIGSHPLAGSEQTGVEAARANLFDGSVCVVTTQGLEDKDNLSGLEKFWASLGAEVCKVSPEEHDLILSFTSHLPHIAAFALSASQKKENIKFMATGFKDTTRIAASDAGLWSDIFLSNKENVLKSIKEFKASLEGIEKAIEKSDEAALKEQLDAARRFREDVV